MSSDDESNASAPEPGLESPDVVTKYKAAASIANSALSLALSLCTPGASAADLCAKVDAHIVAETAKVYNKPVSIDPSSDEKIRIEKGIAFPTSLAPNSCAGHLAPFPSEDLTLADGDLTSISLGVHIDGYIAILTTTALVGAPPTSPSPADDRTQKIADAWNAAHVAAEIAQRLLRPGNTNAQVSDALAKVAAEFKCALVEGVLSHQMKRYVIDGNKVILAKPTPEQKVENAEFAENEVYAVDIAVSTGDGKTREKGTRTTIFKRQVDREYQLKLKASRQLFSEINAKYTALPFSLRALGDERKAKLGITEIVNHELVVPYPVLYEKDGEIVARYQFTALVMPSQTIRITEMSAPALKSQYTVQDEGLKAILAQSVSKKANKKKKKKAADKMDTKEDGTGDGAVEGEE